MATKKKVGSKPSRGKKVSAGHFQGSSRKIKLAPGAMTRLFGKDNEPTENNFISESELILADAEQNPHSYPELSKPRKKPVNPSGKSGYYKR